MFHDAPVEAAVAVHRHRTRGTSAAKDAAERIRREYQLHRVAAFLLTGTDPASTSSSPAAAPPPADSSPSSSAAEQQAQGGSSACCQCGSSCAPSTPAAPYVRVALQFPDELLSDSVAVVSALQELLAADPRYAAAMATKFAAASAGSSETASKAATAPVPPQRPAGAGAAAGSGVVVGARPPALDNPHSPVGAVRLFVLADNTFGSCCPDEITAQHYMTDCIVHFGDACMSRSTRLPVLYIQPAFHFDAIAQGSSEGRAEAERGGGTPAAASAYSRGALTHAESSVVLGVVERVLAALQRRVAAWRAEQGIEAADVRDVTPRLAVVGTYPTKAVMLRAQQRWLTRSDTPEKDSCVPVDWPRFEERNGVLPGGDTITNPAAVEASVVAEGGDAAEDDWVVNGVRFPRLRSGAAREVQYLLFVGASGSSALVHVLTAEQYNEYHYSEACREFLEWDSGEEETTVPVVTVVNNTFGIDALEEGGTVVAELLRPAADALQQQKQSSGSGVESVPTAVLARLDEAVAQWLSTALADGVCALVTGDYVVAQQALQRRVRQRAFNIESVRASSAVGVLVASLAIEGYYELTQQLHQLLRAYGKRSYVIYVGHLNEFKLANFVDTVDCFVAVACPYSRQSHFPEKRDNFMKPIVSPAELLVALTTTDDSDDSAQYGMAAVYTTAFDAVLRVLRRAVAERKAEVARRTAAASGGGEGDEEARRRKAEEEERWASSGALVRAGGAAGGGALTVHDSSQGALARLYEREYVGLDPRIGQTPVQAEVLEGKHGIARGYAKEREEQHAEPPVSNYK